MTENFDFAERINQAINDVTSHLRQRNGNLKSMEYFYGRASQLYGEHVNELKEAKEEGTKVVGTLCNLVPSELIRASGAVPLRLCGGFEGSISSAEKVLPRVYCPLVKSTFGLLEGRSPYFDLIDVVVVPTTCDGKKKMAELLVKSKQTWILEVPHTTITYQSREFWFDNLKLLKKQLEALTKNRISKKRLKESTEVYNRMRSLIHRLYEVRKRENIPIWGGDVLLVTNMAFYDDPQKWISATESLCLEIEAKQENSLVPKETPRLLITGTPMVLPAWKLVKVIEDIGGIIVTDDICTGSKNLWDPVTPSHYTLEEMLIAIADKYLMNTCPCFVPNTARIDRTLQFIKDFRVEGVVNYMLQGCHPFGSEDWQVRDSLKKIDIPVFSLDTDYGDGDVGQIRLRMEAFMEMVRGKRKENPLF
jgi:benzoyl-CoA reductase/2-hydroxyglutaryl-CoA dehydratase subunit BcrC/BadD/HgdB